MGCSTSTTGLHDILPPHGLAEVAERRVEHEQALEHLDRAGELFSRHGAKLYLDQVLARKGILKPQRRHHG